MKNSDSFRELVYRVGVGFINKIFGQQPSFGLKIVYQKLFNPNIGIIIGRRRYHNGRLGKDYIHLLCLKNRKYGWIRELLTHKEMKCLECEFLPRSRCVENVNMNIKKGLVKADDIDRDRTYFEDMYQAITYDKKCDDKKNGLNKIS